MCLAMKPLVQVAMTELEGYATWTEIGVDFVGFDVRYVAVDDVVVRENVAADVVAADGGRSDGLNPGCLQKSAV